MEAFDKDGNAIEGVFSQEELDAKIAEGTEAQAEAIKAAEEAAIARYKEENPPVAEETAEAKAAREAAEAAATKDDEPPAWAKELTDKVNNLTGNQNRGYVDKVTDGLDADRAKEVNEKFNLLTGYEDTPEGLARKAEDAHLLVVGEKFSAGGVNMGNLNAGGTGKAEITTSDFSSQTDKDLNNMLGNTDADIKKYGGGDNK